MAEQRVRLSTNRYQQWLDENEDKPESIRARVRLRGEGIDPYGPEARAEWEWLRDLEQAAAQEFPCPECTAKAGDPCRDEDYIRAVVHFDRTLVWERASRV